MCKSCLNRKTTAERFIGMGQEKQPVKECAELGLLATLTISCLILYLLEFVQVFVSVNLFFQVFLFFDVFSVKYQRPRDI